MKPLDSIRTQIRQQFVTTWVTLNHRFCFIPISLTFHPYKHKEIAVLAIMFDCCPLGLSSPMPFLGNFERVRIWRSLSYFLSHIHPHSHIQILSLSLSLCVLFLFDIFFWGGVLTSQWFILGLIPQTNSPQRSILLAHRLLLPSNDTDTVTPLGYLTALTPLSSHLGRMIVVAWVIIPFLALLICEFKKMREISCGAPGRCWVVLDQHSLSQQCWMRLFDLR